MNTTTHVNTRDFAWHYTTGDNARKIIDSGIIKVADIYLPEGERPIVWFSTHPIWEPTARKTWSRPDGSKVLLTVEGTIELGGGGARFGISKNNLLPWSKLKTAANISKGMAFGLRKAGKRQGADPSQWYGSLTPVPITECIMQIYEDEEWSKKKYRIATLA